MTPIITARIHITAILTTVGIITAGRLCRFRLAGAVTMAAAIMVAARFAAAAAGCVAAVAEFAAVAAGSVAVVVVAVNSPVPSHRLEGS